MPDLTLDHVIIGVADLNAASASLTTALGREPSWRGRHPTYGTSNVLYRLESSYLELLAPDPDATAAAAGQAWAGSLGRFLNEKGEGLFSIALQTPNVMATTALARSRGLPVEDPAEGEGRDVVTGATRRWSNARIPPESTRGTRCFFIQHLSPPDALPPAGVLGRLETAVLDIASMCIESAEVDAGRAMWRDTFGLQEESRSEGGWRYDLGNASLLLQPGPRAADTPDRWSLLVLRVYSLNDAIERLVQSKVAYEHGEAFGIRGITVSACGSTILLTDA
jgi:catechol 2,3-dioxygenase-like lactoylglutathione lyase family enzyme